MVKSGARHEEFACVARLSIITKGRSARPDGEYSPHQKGVGPVAHKGGESHIDLAAGARLDDLDLQPNGARICTSVAKATSMSRIRTSIQGAGSLHCSIESSRRRAWTPRIPLTIWLMRRSTTKLASDNA